MNKLDLLRQRQLLRRQLDAHESCPNDCVYCSEVDNERMNKIMNEIEEIDKKIEFEHSE